ncbi:MAG: CPBP family intramembrane glutamic endopeptidase [Bacteroidota bacterium]
MDSENQNNPGNLNDSDNSFKPIMSPMTAALFGLAAVFILYQFGGAILTLVIFGFDFEKADVNSIRLLTIGGQILLILLPTLLLTKFIYPDVTAILRVRFPKRKEIGIFSLGLILITPLLQSYAYIQNFFLVKLAASSPVVKSVKDFIDQLDKMVESAYGSLLVSNSIFESSFIIFVVAVIPAICEETFFRGYILKSFEYKFKPVWAALITAIFFGIYHFNPYGLLPLIALGFFFGFAAYKSNSIFLPMFLHFLNNFLAVTAFLILDDPDLISSSATIDNDIVSQVIIFAILLIIFLGYIQFVRKRFYKNESQNITINPGI